MAKFQRIYWLGAFDWPAYARLYHKYCQVPKNYYAESAQCLISAVSIPRNAHIVDAGAGTGAFTRTLLETRKDVKITAVDLSPDMLHYYEKQMRKEIAAGRIKLHEGNAEKLDKYVTKPVDIIFVSSALWDMELPEFFKSANKILKPEGLIVFNLPALVLGKMRGFIGFIEQTVRKEMPGKQLYRRILPKQLYRLFKKFNYEIIKEKHYDFKMPKDNVAQFFKVLRYRYPFILFPKELPYAQRLKICTRMFNFALKNLPKQGLTEEGTIFVIKRL